MSLKTVLIVDDEPSIRTSLQGALSDEGYSTLAAANGQEGLELTRARSPDLILLDIWMPGIDGLATLQQLKAEFPTIPVVMMSGHGTIETAVKATKLGAYDFIEKPLNLERILVVLQNVFASQDLVRENVALKKQLSKQRTLLGNSPQIRALQDLIRRVAPTTGSVLITGENGTGKEVVAHSIHALSSRFQKPFIEVNCAAIPEELIESELFGHEKGAFTGATALRRGKFDLAHGGTLFLDEIGDMSLKTQAKVLRIVQEQKFERVGGTQTLSVDVRILAATNKDLKAEIARGTFREDLYYRLNVIPIQLLPLRDRKEDIPLLAAHFLAEANRAHGRKERALTTEAVELLSAYPWPGNVRELKNLMERLVILTPESEEGLPVRAGHLFSQFESEFGGMRPAEADGSTPLVVEDGGSGTNLRDARAQFEREFILKTLKENDWNISKTALILGIERSYLHRKIKGYGIEEK